MSDKYRVMIIDDEADIRHILQICLQQEYEVVSAVNGFDALEKLDRYQPDVICSDISMPVMDGLTATKLIRRNPDHVKTPICIISANTTAEFMKEAYASGANFFISKPFEPQRVIGTVKAQIEKHQIKPRAKTYTLMQLAELEIELAKTAAASKPSAPAAAPPRSKPGAPAAPPPRVAPAPAAAPRPAFKAAPTPAQTAAASKMRPRILIIDDDESVVLNLCNILSKPYEIVPIVDPLEAMEKLVKWEPDIMILAMNMPKLNGLQVVQMLQPNPALAGIEIVFTHDRVTSGIQRSAERFTRNRVLGKQEVLHDIDEVLRTIVSRPGFKIRPKKTTYFNVSESFMKELEETKKEKQREFQKMYSEQRYKELRSFIGTHFSKKEA